MYVVVSKRLFIITQYTWTREGSKVDYEPVKNGLLSQSFENAWQSLKNHDNSRKSAKTLTKLKNAW